MRFDPSVPASAWHSGPAVPTDSEEEGGDKGRRRRLPRRGEEEYGDDNDDGDNNDDDNDVDGESSDANGYEDGDDEASSPMGAKNNDDDEEEEEEEASSDDDDDGGGGGGDDNNKRRRTRVRKRRSKRNNASPGLSPVKGPRSKIVPKRWDPSVDTRWASHSKVNLNSRAPQAAPSSTSSARGRGGARIRGRGRGRGGRGSGSRLFLFVDPQSRKGGVTKTSKRAASGGGGGDAVRGGPKVRGRGRGTRQSGGYARGGRSGRPSHKINIGFKKIPLASFGSECFAQVERLLEEAPNRSERSKDRWWRAREHWAVGEVYTLLGHKLKEARMPSSTGYIRVFETASAAATWHGLDMEVLNSDPRVPIYTVQSTAGTTIVVWRCDPRKILDDLGKWTSKPKAPRQASAEKSEASRQTNKKVQKKGATKPQGKRKRITGASAMTENGGNRMRRNSYEQMVDAAKIVSSLSVDPTVEDGVVAEDCSFDTDLAKMGAPTSYNLLTRDMAGSYSAMNVLGTGENGVIREPLQSTHMKHERGYSAGMHIPFSSYFLSKEPPTVPNVPDTPYGMLTNWQGRDMETFEDDDAPVEDDESIVHPAFSQNAPPPTSLAGSF